MLETGYPSKCSTNHASLGEHRIDSMGYVWAQIPWQPQIVAPSIGVGPAAHCNRVLWRHDGRQRSLIFENLPAARARQNLLDDHGPDEALRIIEIDEIGRRVPTVTEWLTTHIDNLTGVKPATLSRYRTYVARDVDPVFGSMPLTAVTETTIARWVKQRGGSGKTISNKHGFLSGAFNAAVRAGVMASNPCQGRRLPHTRVEETVFLTPPEFTLLRDHIDKQRWKRLATWLVTTGMRFSEATALTAADIDADAKTCRITKAWKYSGDYRPQIGPPKTKKSIRTISLPPPALEVVDLTAPGFLFTNGAGNPSSTHSSVRRPITSTPSWCQARGSIR